MLLIDSDLVVGKKGKRGFAIAIPANFRKERGLTKGDIMEAYSEEISFDNGKELVLVFRPKKKNGEEG